MLDFIKKYIFFKMDKDTKNAIRNKIKVADHRGFQIAVLLIALFQIVMLVSNLFRKGFEWTGYVIPYRILYIVLATFSLLFFIALEIMYKKKTSTNIFYFVVISYTTLVLIWGVGISVFDSYKASIITTFSYVVITLAAFITVVPWLYILESLLTTVILNILLIVYPESVWSTSALINSISVFVLSSMVSVYSFYRRANSFLLEIEVQKLNNVLEQKAYIDDLTSLYNRRYLSEHMKTPLDYSELSSGVLILDIDFFKRVNDTYGHLVGDEVLRTIGRIVLNQKNYSYAIRYGGEEVLIFFKNISDDSLYSFAENLRKCVESERIAINEKDTISVTISIGIAKAKNNVSYNDLIYQSDEALYEAKMNGKNQTVWFKE